MTAAFEVQARGGARAGARLIADPGAGALIKEERKTVVWRQALPDGTPAVWKLYRLRKPSLLEKAGLYVGRAEREYRALAHLVDHGVACSEPLFWAIGRRPEMGRYELLVTREIAGASDLRDWLDRNRDLPPPDLHPLFALAAALHRSGLQHGALLGRNVLIRNDAFFLIDLPRSQRFGRSIEGRGPGLFDLKVLAQSLTPQLPDEPLIRGLAGYPRLPVPATDLVRAMRPQPLNNRRLNTLHAVFTVQAGWSRLFAAP